MKSLVRQNLLLHHCTWVLLLLPRTYVSPNLSPHWNPWNQLAGKRNVPFDATQEEHTSTHTRGHYGPVGGSWLTNGPHDERRDRLLYSWEQSATEDRLNYWIAKRWKWTTTTTTQNRARRCCCYGLKGDWNRRADRGGESYFVRSSIQRCNRHKVARFISSVAGATLGRRNSRLSTTHVDFLHPSVRPSAGHRDTKSSRDSHQSVRTIFLTWSDSAAVRPRFAMVNVYTKASGRRIRTVNGEQREDGSLPVEQEKTVSLRDYTRLDKGPKAIVRCTVTSRHTHTDTVRDGLN